MIHNFSMDLHIDALVIALCCPFSVKDCGTPPDVAKATFTSTTTTVGSHVTYTCSSGFVYNGVSLTVSCTLQGAWTQPDGSCVGR